MRAEVHLLLVASLDEYGRRRIDAIGRTVLCPVAVCIASGRICRVLACSRIKEHLRIEDVIVPECGTEHAEVAFQTIVEGMLCDIYFGYKIVVVLGLDDGVVVDISELRTIV